MAHRNIIGLFWATASHFGWHITGVSFEINQPCFFWTCQCFIFCWTCQLSLLSTGFMDSWASTAELVSLSHCSSLGTHFLLCLQQGRNGPLFVPPKHHPLRVSDSSGLLPHFAFIDTLLRWVDSRSWRARHSPHKGLCPGKLEDFFFSWV